ncbi:uncharacterized protein LOC116351467 [Contarinia nasturtii]|uniref:uncharacterized protein LOC116351467 n=1 Tax=Contarinia nasturtii TaxID=265458 RepID=UPI0012D3C50A|nr:uncharacterized protein LOC116351467 [Contarinia nasturtii]
MSNILNQSVRLPLFTLIYTNNWCTLLKASIQKQSKSALMGNTLIKLIKLACSFYLKTATNKIRKLAKNGAHEMLVDPSTEDHHLSSPPIFKLNNHCFEELFEYLSLLDLHSLGQTCKSMQQMTGEFFTQNHSAGRIVCKSDGIYAVYSSPENIDEKCIPIPGFLPVIISIAMESSDLNAFVSLKSHANKLVSVKQLSFSNLTLNEKDVKCIRKILRKIQVLKLQHCVVQDQDFYKLILQHCKDIRRISIQFSSVKFHYGHKWLKKHYPKLEHLDLNLECSWKIDELSTFFKRNPNLRSFSYDSYSVWPNKDALLKSKIKLDTFELKFVDLHAFVVKCFRYERGSKGNELKILWDLLKQLRIQGFYKRLRIGASSNHTLENDQCLNKSLNAIAKSIGVAKMKIDQSIFFDLYENYKNNEMCTLLCNDVVNVKRLYLNTVSAFDILPIIQQAKNVKKIKFHPKTEFKSNVLKLEFLNAEREKLDGAKKVTIYVPDDVFATTKWATKNGNTDLGSVEIKRIESYDWNL